MGRKRGRRFGEWENFQERGTRPEEIERLNEIERGWAIEAVALSI